MALIDSAYAPGVRELLGSLDASSLYSIASTATNNRILPDNNKEAVQVILRYTESLGRFFSYRKITSQLLFDYLHRKKVAGVRVGDVKAELIEKVKEEWEKSYSKKEEKAARKRQPIEPAATGPTAKVQAIPTPQRLPAFPGLGCGVASPPPAFNTTFNVNITTPGVEVNLQVNPGHGGSGGGIKSDIFTLEFCTWFYTMLNRLQPQCLAAPGDKFSPEAFMGNCSMSLYLCGSQTAEKHASGKTEAYVLLKSVCEDYGLCFVPNLESGVRLEMSDHGLLKLLCCGTLQQGEAMVGVFEQEFGLVKAPDDRWKIMQTKVNLKHAQSVASLPSIPKGPVFEI